MYFNLQNVTYLLKSIFMKELLNRHVFTPTMMSTTNIREIRIFMSSLNTDRELCSRTQYTWCYLSASNHVVREATHDSKYNEALFVWLGVPTIHVKVWHESDRLLSKICMLRDFCDVDFHTVARIATTFNKIVYV